MRKEPPPVGGGSFRMPENPWDFQAKGLQSAACIICVPMAHKFHTGSLRGIFADVHAASENHPASLPPVGGKLCETCGGAKKSRLLLGGGSWGFSWGQLTMTVTVSV